MPRVIDLPLESACAARLELWRPSRPGAGWSLALVVPERELSRFGDASVLDLLDLAAEIEVSGLHRRAA